MHKDIIPNLVVAHEFPILPYQPTNFCLGPNICMKFLTLIVKSRECSELNLECSVHYRLSAELREILGALREISKRSELYWECLEIYQEL